MPDVLATRPLGTLRQYHAWPDRFGEMAVSIAEHYRVTEPPAAGRSARGGRGSLLRVHPQRLWLIADETIADGPALAPDIGVALDLSQSRSIIHVDAASAEPLLSRFITLDLRHFPIDAVATTPLHRVAVLLWRRPDGIDILAPRSFARSLRDLLQETADRPQ